MNKLERLQHARDSFANLRLGNWELANQEVSQGGQSGVCAVIRSDGFKGVFRCLPPCPTERAKRRFARETTVLRDVQHKNVVRLIECGTTPPYWYITEMGEDLNRYWQRILATQSIRDQESACLQVVRGIAEGLAACHTKDLVHRDVKPKNVVVYDRDGRDVPVLIDFGLVWVEGEERLTEEGDAVGNATCSPDLLRRRVDDCPAWVDVFSVVQVFQWMISERDAKHYWQRPIHWRYLSYPVGSSIQFIGGLRAIGAVSSSEITCPNDGGVLVRVLDALFPIRTDFVAGKAPLIFNDAVRLAIAAGRQEKAIREAEDSEVVIASREFAFAVLAPLVKEIATLHAPPMVALSIKGSLVDLFTGSSNDPLEADMLEYTCTAEGGSSFRVRMTIHAFVPSRWPNGNKPESLVDSNVFAFSFERTGPSAGNAQFPSAELLLTIERDGTFLRHGRGWAEKIDVLSVEDVRNEVSKLLAESSVWKHIAGI